MQFDILLYSLFCDVESMKIINRFFLQIYQSHSLKKIVTVTHSLNHFVTATITTENKLR